MRVFVLVHAKKPTLTACVPPRFRQETEPILGNDETAQTLADHAGEISLLDVVAVLSVDAVAAPDNLHVCP